MWKSIYYTQINDIGNTHKGVFLFVWTLTIYAELAIWPSRRIQFVPVIENID